MGNEVDYYDVQAMVEKAVDAERWSRNRHVESIEKDLRAEFRREVMELREEVGALVAEVHKALRTESDERAGLLAAIERVQAARAKAGL